MRAGEELDDDGEGEGTGRPRRTDWQGPFLEAYALLGIVTEAARACGVSPSTVRREIKRNAGFARDVERATESANGRLERFLLDRGTVGQEVTETRTKTYRDAEGREVTETIVTTKPYVSTASLLALAKARMPERFSERFRIAHSGPDGGPIQVEEHERRLESAVERFDAEVVRLADRRAAREAARADSG